MQDDALLVGIDPRLGINGQGEAERLQKGRLDLAHQAETGAGLGVDRGPTDRCGFAEGMKPPNQMYTSIAKLRVSIAWIASSRTGTGCSFSEGQKLGSRRTRSCQSEGCSSSMTLAKVMASWTKAPLWRLSAPFSR